VLVFRAADETADFGDVRVGPKKLQLAQAQGTRRRAMGQHHRRHGDEPAARVAQDMRKQLVADERAALAQMLPPQQVPER
jgi:hypothetical protein